MLSGVRCADIARMCAGLPITFHWRWWIEVLFSRSRKLWPTGNALIQPYSVHASRKSLEVYSRLSIGEAQEEYNSVIGRFSI